MVDFTKMIQLDFFNTKIFEFIIDTKFNLSDTKKYYVLCNYLIYNNNIYIKYYLNEKIKKYDIDNFMYNLFISNSNIRLTFTNDLFLEKIFTKRKITTYTVHKIIMFDKLIGKYFANYYIKYLKNKYINKQNSRYYADINNLIGKIIGKKFINSINYPFIKLFESGINEFTIENVNGYHRLLMYYFAIFYGYIWFNKPIKYIIHSYNPDFPERRWPRHKLWDYLKKIAENTIINYEGFNYDHKYDYFTLKIKKFYSPEIFTRVGNICYLNKPTELSYHCTGLGLKGDLYKVDTISRIDNIVFIKI